MSPCIACYLGAFGNCHVLSFLGGGVGWGGVGGGGGKMSSVTDTHVVQKSRNCSLPILVILLSFSRFPVIR